VTDGPAWVPPTTADAAPLPQSLTPSGDPLRRYRALQIVSILLIVGGMLTTTLVVALNMDVLLATESLDPASLGRAIGVLLAVVVGALSFVIGLVMNAIRAIIVRRALPPTRYRGPSIFVLLLITAIIASIGSIGAGSDLLRLQSGGALTIGGSLLLLTINQIGLLITAGLFVIAPSALAGVRMMGGGRGAVRSILLGLALAIPGWLGVTMVALVLQALLDLVGHRAEPGLLEVLMARIDPTVLVLALVVVAPAAEELFFRGVVYNAWAREHGPRVALFGSAALFALIHANPESGEALIGSMVSVVPIFGLGIGLAILYRTTGSLLAPMALHAGFNAISATIVLLVRAGVLDIPLPT
jgi:membrane protease YdiL (CAAX protease family)